MFIVYSKTVGKNEGLYFMNGFAVFQDAVACAMSRHNENSDICIGWVSSSGGKTGQQLASEAHFNNCIDQKCLYKNGIVSPDASELLRA